MPDRPTSPQPELLTISEAADLLRTPVATLRFWRHLGTGPRGFRLGRRVLYRRDEIDAWIDAQQAREGVARLKSPLSPQGHLDQDHADRASDVPPHRRRR